MDIISKDSKTYINNGKQQLAVNPGLGNELLSQGMNLVFQIQGPMNADTASCMSKLGSVHLKYGDFSQALNLQQRSALIFREILGEINPQVAFSYSQLGMYYHSVGNFERAFQLLYRALYILDLVCGWDHPDIAQIYVNMAHMYSELDHQAAAQDSYMKALYRLISLFGELDLQVALVYQYMASLASTTSFRKALDYQQQAMKILEAVFKENDKHPLLINSKQRILQLTALAEQQDKQTPDTGREIGSNKPKNQVGKMMAQMANPMHLQEIQARIEGQKKQEEKK